MGNLSEMKFYKRIRQVVNNNKNIIANFNYLALLESLNLVIPLLAVPYLLRVLGSENYGNYIFGLAIVSYLVVIISFGFNISEIHAISIHRGNKRRLSEILSSVLVIRIILAILLILLFSILILSWDKLRNQGVLYWGFLLFLVDAAINPSFFFQGIEKMKVITFTALASKILYIALLLLIVNEADDYVYVPMVSGAGMLTGNIIGIIIMKRYYNVVFVRPGRETLSKTFKDSLPFFTSRLSVLLSSKVNILLIGSSIGYTAVAYYDLADKLTTAVKIPFNIVNKVLYPSVSFSRDLSKVRKALKVLLVLYIVGISGMWIIDKCLIQFLGGVEMLGSVTTLRILIIGVIFELVSVFLGAPMLLVMGFSREYNQSIIYGALFNIFSILMIYVANIVRLEAFSMALVLTSLFVMTYRFYHCMKKGLISRSYA